MENSYNFPAFSKKNNVLSLPRVKFDDCGITVDTTIEYCQTPKGVHFIVTHINSGKLLHYSEVDNILGRNNDIILELLKQNEQLKPILVSVYDVSKISNFKLQNTLSLLFKFSKYSNQLVEEGVPMGYRGVIAIMSTEGASILQKVKRILPTKKKTSVLIFKTIEEAKPALELVRNYGLVF